LIGFRTGHVLLPLSGETTFSMVLEIACYKCTAALVKNLNTSRPRSQPQSEAIQSHTAFELT
jgi:hypothetical protein